MSQIAKKKFPHAMLLGGLSVNLNHLKTPYTITPQQILKPQNNVPKFTQPTLLENANGGKVHFQSILSSIYTLKPVFIYSKHLE